MAVEAEGVVRIYSFSFSFSLAVLLFSLVLHGGAAEQGFQQDVGTRTYLEDSSHKHELHCSRERSRAAWKVVEEYLMPFVEKQQFQLSKKCRLNPQNDMFREQEEHKIHVDVNDWKCGFCKKSFRAEKYLDKHFDNRHSNLINDSQGRCLADLCGALHCDQVIESKKPKGKCNPAAASRNRHLCESLADGCFPVSEGPKASRLHEFFLRQFCDAHTCSGGPKPFSKGGKKRTNVLWLASSILIILLLPLFYLLVYLHRREMKTVVKDFRRIGKGGRNKKAS
ncbi:C2H2-like zinc finger protein [Rhynchospora pubera]|uniref:C2H2-like zinc finger protein n=1 Tax=Rhynchospora pubera TaxID=906938 RepID=A0AAV8CKM7_9POAL|nr:C2H2-like zinc finger protein [Rhynchospora pubera]